MVIKHPLFTTDANVRWLESEHPASLFSCMASKLDWTRDCRCAESNSRDCKSNLFEITFNQLPDWEKRILCNFVGHALLWIELQTVNSLNGDTQRLGRGFRLLRDTCMYAKLSKKCFQLTHFMCLNLPSEMGFRLLINRDAAGEWECECAPHKTSTPSAQKPRNWSPSVELYTSIFGLSNTRLFAWIALQPPAHPLSLSRSTFLLLQPRPPQAPSRSLTVQPRFDLEAQVIYCPANFSESL